MTFGYLCYFRYKEMSIRQYIRRSGPVLHTDQEPFLFTKKSSNHGFLFHFVEKFAKVEYITISVLLRIILHKFTQTQCQTH